MDLLDLFMWLIMGVIVFSLGMLAYSTLKDQKNK